MKDPLEIVPPDRMEDDEILADEDSFFNQFCGFIIFIFSAMCFVLLVVMSFVVASGR